MSAFVSSAADVSLMFDVFSIFNSGGLAGISPVGSFVWCLVVTGISGITSWFEDSARMGILFDWKPSHSRKSIYKTTNIAHHVFLWLLPHKKSSLGKTYNYFPSRGSVNICIVLWEEYILFLVKFLS